MESADPTPVQRIIAEYHAGLTKALGRLLEQVVLYGSYSRGTAGPESDIDILCVLREPFDFGAMIARTSELTAALSLKYDVVISRTFVTSRDYATRQTPFLMGVRKEHIQV
ncbi:MAG: nucleotidyltransferase domain-containing protein [Planctomycetota bacterium]